MTTVTSVLPESDGKHRNMALQALRGVAAAAVMIYHASHFTAAKTNTPWLEEVFSGRLGLYGVLVFFVLSGFLMESAVRRYDAPTFLLHRFVRLYPTYWLIFLGYFLLQSLRAGAWGPIPWTALTLLPVGETYRPLHVEWTLLYEVFFYAVCALLCLWKRAHFLVHVAWLLVVFIAVVQHAQYGTSMQPTLAEIPFSAWNVGFICGALAGHIARSKLLPSAAVLVLCGLALLGLGELFGPAERLFLASPGLACVVIALVVSPKPAQFAPGLLMRVLFVLGECSYGLYLAHSLAIQVALQYVPAAHLTEPVAVFSGMLGVGLVAGLIAGGVDIVLYRRLKSGVDRWLVRCQQRTMPLPTAG